MSCGGTVSGLLRLCQLRKYISVCSTIALSLFMIVENYCKIAAAFILRHSHLNIKPPAHAVFVEIFLEISLCDVQSSTNAQSAN